MSKEKRKKFNVRAFRNLTSESEMLAYAKKFLACLGQGSSRVVFAYSHSKVLKIAINDKGYAQNAAEVVISQNSETKNAISRIHDSKIDSDGRVIWLISEMVRTVVDPDEFKELAGFSWEVYVDTVKAFAKVNAQEHLETITSDISKQYSKRMVRLKNQGDERNAKYYERLLFDLDAMKKSDFFVGIISAMKTNRLMSGDILELDHYGKTVNGTIVLFDYGFTEEIAKKFYPKSEESKAVKNVINLSDIRDADLSTRQELKIPALRKKAI